jgi:hypothetical protein
MQPKNQQEILKFAKKCILDSTLKSRTLWSVAQSGKYMKWQIIIGIQDEDGNNQDIEWSMIEDRETDKKLIGYYYTNSSQENGKERISKTTMIRVGKNIGKNNYTTPLTQAIYDAMSLYDKRVKTGSSIDKKNLITPTTKLSIKLLLRITRRGATPWRVHPMALHDYADFAARIVFPFFIQRKFDGTRFIAVFYSGLPPKKINGKDITIDCYSRGREDIEGQDHILEELAAALKAAGVEDGIYLDGELWKSGYGLQEISGFSRRQDGTKLGKSDKLEYHIYDCFYIDKPDLAWSDRMKILQKIGTGKYIKIVESVEVANKQELTGQYKKFLKEKYEGAVVRDAKSKYEFGADKEKRSYTTLKLKPRPDSEWPITNFDQGLKGKAVGAVKWICSSTRETIKRDGGPATAKPQTFAVVPNWTDDVKYKVYKLLSDDPNYFKNNIKNQMATIQYSVLSNNKVPQQPKMLYLKNQDLQKKLIADAKKK